MQNEISETPLIIRLFNRVTKGSRLAEYFILQLVLNKLLSYFKNINSEVKEISISRLPCPFHCHFNGKCRRE